MVGADAESGGRRFVTVAAGEIHGTPGHDGGNGVLVDHLGDGIAQQYDVLVKRFDLPLQLDPVDEIDGNRDMLTTQGVEKRVLEQLAFVVHDILRVQEINKGLTIPQPGAIAGRGT